MLLDGQPTVMWKDEIAEAGTTPSTTENTPAPAEDVPATPETTPENGAATPENTPETGEASAPAPNLHQPAPAPTQDEPAQREYRLNDTVPLQLPDGSIVQATVQQEEDADGRIEVATDMPVNGRRVNWFTRQELDAMAPKPKPGDNGAGGAPVMDTPTPEAPAPDARQEKKRKQRKRMDKHLNEMRQAKEKGDDFAVIDALNSIEHNHTVGGAELDVLTPEEKAEIEAETARMKAAGYTWDNVKRGDRYDEGMKVIADFTTNDNLAPGEKRIKQVKKPTIIKDGKMVQAANILVEQSPYESEEEAEAARTAAPQNEADGKGTDYTLSDVLSDNGEHFYQDRNGNIDLVSIPQEVFDHIGRNAAPFRLIPSMLKHVFDRHGKELQLSSPQEAIKIVLDVMGTFDHVRLGEGGALIFSVENGRHSTGKRAVTVLLPSANGDYYGIKSSGYERIDGLTKRELLWEKGANVTSPTDVASANVPTANASQGNGQSGSASNIDNSSTGKGSETSAPTQEQTADGLSGIRSRWENAPKVVGDADEIVLPDGSRLKGRYVLVESGAASASHNAMEGFAKTGGFPTDEHGNTVNDRDYERDRDAQEVTRRIGARYDSRALQSPVVVSRDGVVLSGNGRTMAGELAARDNTDGEYNAYLREYPAKFGFTAEQVSAMAHPRVVFVPDTDLPYTTETFARFNRQEMKSQSKTEQTVKLGKIVDNATFARILQVIGGYDTLGEFYNDARAARAVMRQLVDAGVVDGKQLAELFDGNGLSVLGRDLLENVLIGKAFEGYPDAVRMLSVYRGMRQRVVTALGEISRNSALDEAYSLGAELAEAVRLCYEARNSGYASGERVSQHARQGNLFESGKGGTVSDYRNTTILMLADVLNDQRVTRLKKVMKLYNDSAQLSASGQSDLFGGSVRSKEDILNDVFKILDYGTKEGQQGTQAAGRRNTGTAGTGKDGPAGKGNPDGGGRGQARRGQNPKRRIRKRRIIPKGESSPGRTPRQDSGGAETR